MSAARIALIANGVFVGLLAILHVIRSDVDPSWHFISEYGIGRYGWVMQVAFVSLAAANLGTLVSIRSGLRTALGATGALLFVSGTAGLLMAAMFVCDPVNTPVESQTTSGKLHNIGGGLGLLGFVGTVIISVRLLRAPEWQSARRFVLIATAAIILGFLISFITIGAMAARHNGVFGPDTPVGWPNRIGILSGCVWLAIISMQSIRLADPTQARHTPT